MEGAVLPGCTPKHRGWGRDGHHLRDGHRTQSSSGGRLALPSCKSGRQASVGASSRQHKQQSRERPGRSHQRGQGLRGADTQPLLGQQGPSWGRACTPGPPCSDHREDAAALAVGNLLDAVGLQGKARGQGGQPLPEGTGYRFLVLLAPCHPGPAWPCSPETLSLKSASVGFRFGRPFHLTARTQLCTSPGTTAPRGVGQAGGGGGRAVASAHPGGHPAASPPERAAGLTRQTAVRDSSCGRHC